MTVKVLEGYIGAIAVETAQQIGGAGQQQDEAIVGDRGGAVQKLAGQARRVRVPAEEGTARSRRDRQPDAVLGQLLSQLAPGSTPPIPASKA